MTKNLKKKISKKSKEKKLRESKPSVKKIGAPKKAPFSFESLVTSEKIPEQYNKIKVITKELYPGFKLFYLKKPKKIDIPVLVEDIVLYYDEEVKIGKIKNIVFLSKKPYLEVIEKDHKKDRPILLEETQVIKLDTKSKLYKTNKKHFANV